MDISIGRVVHYTLSEQDAAEINRRRMPTDLGTEKWTKGAMAHVGNHAEAGQVYPAVSVRVFTPGMANLQVLLDGSDTYWATSRHEGTEPGTWAWPPRV